MDQVYIEQKKGFLSKIFAIVLLALALGSTFLSDVSYAVYFLGMHGGLSLMSLLLVIGRFLNYVPILLMLLYVIVFSNKKIGNIVAAISLAAAAGIEFLAIISRFSSYILYGTPIEYALNFATIAYTLLNFLLFCAFLLAAVGCIFKKGKKIFFLIGAILGLVGCFFLLTLNVIAFFEIIPMVSGDSFLQYYIFNYLASIIETVSLAFFCASLFALMKIGEDKPVIEQPSKNELSENIAEPVLESVSEESEAAPSEETIENA